MSDTAYKRKQWEEYLKTLAKVRLEQEKEEADTLAPPIMDPVTEEPKEESLEELRASVEQTLKENRETLDRLEKEADTQMAAGQAGREDANKKSDELYELLLSFAGKQDRGYDDLISAIRTGDYLSQPGTQQILSEYARAGAEAARHASASIAADNGGNPDTYAAAQAARERRAFTDAGMAAAREYYGEQLDRWLAALKAAGADLGDLYRGVQDNVDGRQEAADTDLAIGAELLESLADEQRRNKEFAVETFSSLLEEAEKKKGASISPMQIDREYEALVSGKNEAGTAYSRTDALMLLWDKYPAMRDYIVSKYEELLHPSYSFPG